MTKGDIQSRREGRTQIPSSYTYGIKNMKVNGTRHSIAFNTTKRNTRHFFKATELLNAGSRRGEGGSLSDPDLHLLYLEVNRKVSKFNKSRQGVIRYSGGTVITPEQLKPDYC